MMVKLQLGKEAAKPLTTVQDCVPTFVNKKPMDIFLETLGIIFSHVCIDKNQ